MKKLLALLFFSSSVLAGQDVFVSDHFFVDRPQCGNTLWVNATSVIPIISFDLASNLTVGGTLQCQVTIKKLDLTSNNVIISSEDGTVDGYYVDRHLIQAMDAVTVAAIQNPITGLGGVYVLSRGQDHNEMRAMRTVTIQNYPVTMYDYEVEHRCAPASAGGSIQFYLPPLKQIIGTVPNPGQTPNPNDPNQPAGYLPKTFHFTKIENSAYPCQIIAYSGETLNGKPILQIVNKWDRLTCQAKGDGWTCQLLKAAQ